MLSPASDWAPESPVRSSAPRCPAAPGWRCAVTSAIRGAPRSSKTPCVTWPACGPSRRARAAGTSSSCSTRAAARTRVWSPASPKRSDRPRRPRPDSYRQVVVRSDTPGRLRLAVLGLAATASVRPPSRPPSRRCPASERSRPALTRARSSSNTPPMPGPSRCSARRSKARCSRRRSPSRQLGRRGRRAGAAHRPRSGATCCPASPPWRSPIRRARPGTRSPPRPSRGSWTSSRPAA